MTLTPPLFIQLSVVPSNLYLLAHSKLSSTFVHQPNDRIDHASGCIFCLFYFERWHVEGDGEMEVLFFSIPPVSISNAEVHKAPKPGDITILPPLSDQ